MLYELITAIFLYSSLSFAFAILLISLRNLYRGRWNAGSEIVLLLFSQIGILGIGYPMKGSLPVILLPVLLNAFFQMMTRRFLQNYSLIGRYFLTSYLFLLFSGVIWSIWFISTIPVSIATRSLMLLSAPLLVLLLPTSIVQFIEQFEILCRSIWIRPRHALPVIARLNYPKVSLHVPIYAEPTEIVIETLTILSQIDYPNFEVLVIDNNTIDESLWKPVEAYCLALGDKFRFFHVENMEGAKAGALNFAITKTSPDAEIIGVIDADYHAKPDFLKALIGHFDDPKMGFVQSPHDYRGWENNAYLRMCYYEYKIFFHTIMVSINERDAAMTVGTMCLIRKEALKEAGGWAEWCVTEDSELSIRIHAAGYSSVYLTQTFGKGLIPETFAGYKKQRYRWTAGPVQEFKHHFNLLMVSPFGKSSLLTFFQRLHHFNHGFDRFTVGLNMLLLPIGFSVITSMLLHKEVVQVPFELWLASTVLLVSGLLLNWLLYKVTLGCSLKDTIGALIASKALSHTISVASFKTIFKNRMPWERTNKFKTASRLIRAFYATKTELFLGLFIFACVITAFLVMPAPGLLLMFLIGMSYKGIDYLFAPLVALFAEMKMVRQG